MPGADHTGLFHFRWNGFSITRPVFGFWRALLRSSAGGAIDTFHPTWTQLVGAPLQIDDIGVQRFRLLRCHNRLEQGLADGHAEFRHALLLVRAAQHDVTELPMYTARHIAKIGHFAA